MTKDELKLEALKYHQVGRKGKIEVKATKPTLTVGISLSPILLVLQSLVVKSLEIQTLPTNIRPKEILLALSPMEVPF